MDKNNEIKKLSIPKHYFTEFSLKVIIQDDLWYVFGLKGMQFLQTILNKNRIGHFLTNQKLYFLYYMKVSPQLKVSCLSYNKYVKFLSKLFVSLSNCIHSPTPLLSLDLSFFLSLRLSLPPSLSKSVNIYIYLSHSLLSHILLSVCLSVFLSFSIFTLFYRLYLLII